MTKNKISILGIIILFFIVFLSACRSELDTAVTPVPDDGQNRLSDLADISALQAAFAADAGQPRLLLIVAPT